MAAEPLIRRKEKLLVKNVIRRLFTPNNRYLRFQTFDTDEDLPPPEFEDPEETKVRVALGTTARLECRVANLGGAVISWKKGMDFIYLGSTLMTEDKRIEVPF